MAPSKTASRRAKSASVIDVGDHQPADEVAESASSQGEALPKMLSDMVSQRRQRHAVRKKDVHQAYEEDCGKAQDDINTHFDEHETQASEAHEAQISRLKHLLRKKAEVEEEIAEKTAELRRVFSHYAKTLETVVEFHVKELN